MMSCGAIPEIVGWNSMAEVLAVCISEVRGISKHPVKEIHLIPGHGIEGDAHAGKWALHWAK